jgi:hypothetical protein
MWPFRFRSPRATALVLPALHGASRRSISRVSTPMPATPLRSGLAEPWSMNTASLSSWPSSQPAMGRLQLHSNRRSQTGASSGFGRNISCRRRLGLPMFKPLRRWDDCRFRWRLVDLIAQKSTVPVCTREWIHRPMLLDASLHNNLTSPRILSSSATQVLR